MPVTFNCSCGRQMRAADEHVGKRVKCPGCEAVNVVPAPPSAVPELIRFRCACGENIQARAEHAGKLTRCPSCNEKVRIPVAADTKKSIGSSAANPKIKARTDALPPPVKRPPVRKPGKVEEVEEVEEIEEVEEAEEAQEAETAEAVEEVEDRPKKKKKGRRAGRGWVLVIILGGFGLFLLLGLCGGGIGLYFYMRTPDDLKYIPDDAESFSSTRLADLAKLDKAKDKARAQAGLQGDNGVHGTGLEMADVERLTTVSYKADNKVLSWTIILTVSSADKKKILSKLFKDGSSETKYKDKVIVKGDSKNEPVRPAFPGGPGFNPPPGFPGVPGATAACFVSDRILILGEQAAIEKALDKYPRNNGDGVIASGVKLASRGYQMVSAHVSSGGRGGLGGLSDESPEGIVLAASVSGDNTAEVKFILTFSSSEKAQKAKTKMEEERSKQVRDLENKTDEKSRKALRSIRDASVSLSGKEVTVSAKGPIDDEPGGGGFLFP